MNLDRSQLNGHRGRGRQHREISSLDAAAGDGRDKIRILENGIAFSDPALGRDVERHVLELLAPEDMAGIEVRFRLCRDEADDVKYICKVDYPGDVEHQGAWRWWSPLLSTPDELRSALEEGLERRRQRNGLPRLEPAAPPHKVNYRRRRWAESASRSLKRAAAPRRPS
jgi:hypothetical protein